MKDKRICSGSWRFPCKNVRLNDKSRRLKPAIVKKTILKRAEDLVFGKQDGCVIAYRKLTVYKSSASLYCVDGTRTIVR
jgi:hypothetical protein